jgi:hypothetical protein
MTVFGVTKNISQSNLTVLEPSVAKATTYKALTVLRTDVRD